ncbi:MAG: sugar phosphate nucleotidyltransferase [Candidatus Ratteibacteria bacterium]
MKKTTAILPVAGIGRRLQPHTFTLPKVLLSVAGKPLLGHLIEFILGLGIEEIIFVTGHLGEKIVEYVRNSFPNVRGIFVEQKEFLGLGYAISLTKGITDGPILINLGDTLVEGDFQGMIGGNDHWVGVAEVNDPRRFGVAIEGEDGRVVRMIEKPSSFLSRLALCGIYYIAESALLYDCLDELISGNVQTAGEYQLTDALQKLVERKVFLRAHRVERWFDSGKVETLLATNRYLLEQSSAPLFSLPSVVMNPPVYISGEAHLQNCVVGPFVSIGKGVRMTNVIIENSIVNDHACLKNVVLSDSVIGFSSYFTGNLQKISLGDSSQVSLQGEEGNEESS